MTNTPKVIEILFPQSALSAQCFQRILPGNRTIYVLKFSGEYRDGSAGRGDACYMRMMGHAFRVNMRTWPYKGTWNQGLVLDLMDFVYEYGDDLTMALQFNRGDLYDMPYAVAVGPLARKRIATLLTLKRDAKFDELKSSGYFPALEEALASVEEQMKKPAPPPRIPQGV